MSAPNGTRRRAEVRRRITQRWSARASCVLLLAASCRSTPEPDLPPRIVLPPAAERVPRWREDLAALAHGLRTRHVAPFRVVSEADFDASVARLDALIPELDDASVVVEMARIAASLGDGHTGFMLHGPRLGFRPGRFWFLWLEDGIFVKGVLGDVGADVLDQRLVRVGGVDVEEAVARLAPYVSRDNDMGLRLSVPGYLNLPRVLCAVGLAERPDAVTYAFVDGAGTETEVEVGEVPDEEPAVFAVRYAAGAAGAPLAERLRGGSYAFERIGDAVYLQYDRCRDAAAFRELCQRAFAEVDGANTRLLVVDLRWNQGGDSRVNRVLFDELARRPQLRGPRLRVLIGRGTFSSGMWAAVDLAREFDARLYGEPTGGTPNAPGESATFALPNSTLDCSYSRRQWRYGGKRFSGPALEPDVPVGESSHEHFAGRDPVLEAALADP